MFFFSAATYNGHRIHYDKDWARDPEGYDNVLVQGPLQAALLSRTLTDWIGGDGRLVAFSVQNRAVAYPGQAADVRRRGHGEAGGQAGRPRHLLQARGRGVDARHRDRRSAVEGIVP